MKAAAVFTVMLVLAYLMAVGGALGNQPLLFLVGFLTLIALFIAYAILLVHVLFSQRRFEVEMGLLQEQLLLERERQWASRYFQPGAWQTATTDVLPTQGKEGVGNAGSVTDVTSNDN